MTETPHERTPEATKRLARLAGAVYVSLGVAAALGFYHAPLVQGDLSAIGRTITGTDLRFRIGMVSDVFSECRSKTPSRGFHGLCLLDCHVRPQVFYMAPLLGFEPRKALPVTVMTGV